MPKSHVRTLIYRPVIPVDADYDTAAPLVGETERVAYHLTRDRLVAQIKGGPLPEGDARALADELLRAWEVVIGLQHGPGRLSFEFVQAEAETFADGVNGVEPGLEDTIVLCDEVPARAGHDRFPEPPQRFRLSPVAEMMYERYRLYRAGRESLSGTAYWCLTVLEYSARGRAESAELYRIDPKVLRKLGELCGQRGDVSGRSPYGGGAPLNPAEREWIRAVVRRLILRAGEVAFDPVAKLPRLTMADLPPLPKAFQGAS
jgi:hypothetical protein